MSSKLLLLFLVFCATQLQTSVHGQKSRLTGHHTGLETNVGKPYNGVSGSARHMDEVPEYEKEKGVLVRNKRAAPAQTPATPAAASGTGGSQTTMDPVIEGKIKKRVGGFITVFGALTGALIVLCAVNIGLFVWLSIVLKKLKKP